MQQSSAWKTLERRVARFFQTERTPLSGGNSKITRSDSLHPRLFIETKRATRYKAAITLWDQTNVMARKEQKIPLIAFGAPHRKGFWILVHSDDLNDLCKELTVQRRPE